MFMQRLITSLILIPLVFWVLFYAPLWLLIALVLLLLLAAGRECCKLIPLTNFATQLGFLLLLVCSLWACGQFFFVWLAWGLCFWGLIFIAILTFPQSQYYWGHAPVVALASFLVLPLFLQSLIHLYYLPHGQGLILYLFCIVWAADTGAYLAGKRFGKHKIIPRVSPGKSWEGVLGGFLLVLLVAIIGFYSFNPQAKAAWFLLALGCAVVSIFGDLFISILKRRCNLKDTGALIPGHGGILDRLDSVIAAMPFFYFGLNYLF